MLALYAQNPNLYENFKSYWEGTWLRTILQNDDYVIQFDGEIPCVSAIIVISTNIGSNDGIKVGLSQKQVEDCMGHADFTDEKENIRVLDYRRGNHYFKVYLKKAITTNFWFINGELAHLQKAR